MKVKVITTVTHAVNIDLECQIYLPQHTHSFFEPGRIILDFENGQVVMPKKIEF